MSSLGVLHTKLPPLLDVHMMDAIRQKLDTRKNQIRSRFDSFIPLNTELSVLEPSNLHMLLFGCRKKLEELNNQQIIEIASFLDQIVIFELEEILYERDNAYQVSLEKEKVSIEWFIEMVSERRLIDHFLFRERIKSSFKAPLEMNRNYLLWVLALSKVAEYIEKVISLRASSPVFTNNPGSGFLSSLAEALNPGGGTTNVRITEIAMEAVYIFQSAFYREILKETYHTHGKEIASMEKYRDAISERNRVAVTQGLWQKKEGKLKETIPYIMDIINQGLKHHKIAQKLYDKKDREGHYLFRQFRTDNDAPVDITKPMLVKYVKEYLLSIKRDDLIHGMQKSS